ncbi:unnamed protein product [Cylindrotheca closterium]|uniref:Uncharacterized protein n=1 Tax=Cylindrotheca closterium TaxID=2856 RepID=A0AAD2CWT3_9STRA|nr:unnamed protein product [Cylindrotheca closterium]
MFIKKDLRKIPKILDDAVVCTAEMDTDTDKEDGEERAKRIKLQKPLQELKLHRRKQEFKGTLNILCQPAYLPKLQQLKSLNLYGCDIKDCAKIGMLEACPNLEILNLGRNPISELPAELSQVKSLKEIWLDDCQLAGDFPEPLYDLPNLQVLKLPNNQISRVDGSRMTRLTELRVLCLDRNLLQELPLEIQYLSNLKELFVRHNLLKGTLSPLAPSLEVLHISSNELSDLGTLDVDCPDLKTLYANGNQLVSLPMDLFANCQSLKKMGVSHNQLASVPDSFWTISSCEIVWKPNTQLTPPPSEDVEMEPATE